MKKLFPLLYFPAFFIISCGNGIENSSNKADAIIYSDSGRVFKPTNVEEMSTDYVFDFKFQIPGGFYFDTLHLRDSIHKADYKLYCLQSTLPRMKEFNFAIRNELLHNAKEDMQSVNSLYDEIPVDPLFTYELGPFEFFMNDKLLSLCCIIDTYGFQGNHHNYSWYTFNYNLRQNKIIRFSDVFKINSSADSVEFVRLANRRMENVYRDDWNTPYEPVDFSFVKRGVCVNPDLSWACSMQRAFLTTDSLKKFLNQKWK
jgi:hypothetical protein